MAYRSRLQRIQEKRNLTKAIAMFGIGILIIVVLIFYGVKGMATLAIFIDRLKFGNKGVDVMDKIPPAPPTIWADYQATNSASVKVFALSEPDTELNLLRDGEIFLKNKVDSDGKLTFENVILKQGPNSFLAVALDGAGNKSHESRPLNIVFSDREPELTIEKPTVDQKFSGGDNPIEIKGKTLAFAKVYVNGRLTIADANGGFGIKINLTSGENMLKIRVVDEAMNETNKEIKVFYQP